MLKPLVIKIISINYEPSLQLAEHCVITGTDRSSSKVDCMFVLNVRDVTPLKLAVGDVILVPTNVTVKMIKRE